MRFMRCFGEGGFDMEIGTHLLANYAEVVAVALFGIGFTNLLLREKSWTGFTGGKPGRN